MLPRRAAQAISLWHTQQQTLQSACWAQATARFTGEIAAGSLLSASQEVLLLPLRHTQHRTAAGCTQEYHAVVAPDWDVQQSGRHQEPGPQQQHQHQHQQQLHVLHQECRTPYQAPMQQADSQHLHGAVGCQHAGHILGPKGSHAADMAAGSLAAHTDAATQPGSAASCTAVACDDETEEGATQLLDGLSRPPSGIFEISTPEEQYGRTLAALHAGRSKNLDQLAHIFDPSAVLAAPDRGAAILEALMVAASKLQDLQLLRQLLRCTAAAGNPLSPAGHRAVLKCLAGCGRPAEALQWLQVRVPHEQLTPQMLRTLVQPLIQQQQVQAAQHALDYAEPILQQRWQQQQQQQQHEGLPASSSSTAAASQQQELQQSVLSQADMQELPCLRLLTAAACNSLSMVQQQWTRIQQQAQSDAQVASHVPNSTIPQPAQYLGVMVWANYVIALSKAGKGSSKGPQPALGSSSSAMVQALEVYHTAAWDALLRQRQGHSCAAGSSGTAGSADQAQQWMMQQAVSAKRHWQRHRKGISKLRWQDLDATAVMPQEAASALQSQERDVCRQALHASLVAAAKKGQEATVLRLLMLSSVVKLMPRQATFEALLHLKLKQGAPPEALEELLGEMISWGVLPSLFAYEHLMEAHALHCDTDAAEEVLDRVQAAGHLPVQRTYNRLLHGVAIKGDLEAAKRVYSRMRLQGLQPDIQTMRCLFKCVRMRASNLRVVTARTILQAQPGDRDATLGLLFKRSALFAEAYNQLAVWQRDMAAAGLKHTQPTMTHLTAALERLGAMEDCMQLAKLSTNARPGDMTAHRAALRVAGRMRNVRSAGEASRLADQIAAGEEGLSREDFVAVLSSQSVLKPDSEEMLRTVAAMKAAGHELTQSVLQQLLHVYCHCDMWGEALQVLQDVAAGRFDQPSNSSSSRRQQTRSTAKQQTPGSTGFGLDSDTLWHIIMRKLWERRAPDQLLNDFLRHMHPAQLQRFKLVYGLHVDHSQPGRYSFMPPEDWELPAEKQPAAPMQ